MSSECFENLQKRKESKTYYLQNRDSSSQLLAFSLDGIGKFMLCLYTRSVRYFNSIDYDYESFFKNGMTCRKCDIPKAGDFDLLMAYVIFWVE